MYGQFISMKRYIRLLTWLLALCIALAGGAALAAEAGPRLGLTPGRTLTGRFVHEHPVPGFDKPMRTEGRFILAPGQKMVWEIEKPMMTTTTVIKGEMVQSVGDFPLLRLTPAQIPFLAEAEEKLMLGLNGDWEKLEKDFSVTRKGNDKAWTVTLSPRPAPGKALPFQKIVTTGGRFPDKAVVYLANGTADTFVFTNVALSR